MINSSSDNVKKLNSINRRMFLTGSLKFLIMAGIISRLFFFCQKTLNHRTLLSKRWFKVPHYIGKRLLATFDSLAY